MKFREKATERAIYQLLEVGVIVISVVSVLSILYGFLIVFSIGLNVDDYASPAASGMVWGAGIGWILTGLFEFWIQSRIANIKTGMVQQSSDETK